MEHTSIWYLPVNFHCVLLVESSVAAGRIDVEPEALIKALKWSELRIPTL